MPENFNIENNKKKIMETLEKETLDKFANLSDGHGLGHTLRVKELAKIIALGENADTFKAETAALLHDWGRATEASDPQKRNHAVLSAEAAKPLFRDFYEHKLIGAQQYGDIMRAIKRHDKRQETSRETLTIVRDADRLSRFGAVGMYQNMLGNFDEMPDALFYIEGHTVLKDNDAPALRGKDVQCQIDDFNAVRDYVRILKTESGKKIAQILEPSWHAFLELVSRHLEINDNSFWLAYLKSRAEIVQMKMTAYQQNPDNQMETFDDQLAMLRQIEDVSIFSEDEFKKYQQEYKK